MFDLVRAEVRREVENVAARRRDEFVEGVERAFALFSEFFGKHASEESGDDDGAAEKAGDHPGVAVAPAKKAPAKKAPAKKAPAKKAPAKKAPAKKAAGPTASSD